MSVKIAILYVQRLLIDLPRKPKYKERTCVNLCHMLKTAEFDIQPIGTHRIPCGLLGLCFQCCRTTPCQRWRRRVNLGL